eukprot:GGOE01011002.1.p1 GENE.GGOE01011002.1~~GGOE01011002.1.p1  ORF type:complete len:406 (-),score=67.37 GGOE01011002.1:1963-3180(-)
MVCFFAATMMDNTAAPATPAATKPVTFPQLGLVPWVVQGLESTFHEQPSPVQQRIVPALLQGSSVFLQGCKPCTGKTIACVAAFLHLIDWTENYPQAIFLVPTRELARHIFDVIVELRSSAKCNPIGCCLVVGGKKGPGAGPEGELAERGWCAVVATVGRLHEMAHQGEVDLHRVRHVFLDEADDSLPSSQVESVWSFLNMRAIQWAVTCVRVSPTVERFVEKHLTSSQRLRFLGDDPCVRSPIEHLWVATPGKEAKLEVLLRVCDIVLQGRAVVFCSAVTQKFLHGHLMRRFPRFVQHQRNVVEYLTDGAKILVTTDILARGVHLCCESPSHPCLSCAMPRPLPVTWRRTYSGPAAPVACCSSGTSSSSACWRGRTSAACRAWRSSAGSPSPRCLQSARCSNAE